MQVSNVSVPVVSGDTHPVAHVVSTKKSSLTRAEFNDSLKSWLLDTWHAPPNEAQGITDRRLAAVEDMLCCFDEMEKNPEERFILDLENCQLGTLPDCIGELQNLKGIKVKGNNLTALPKDIGKLENLELLDVSYNQLADLPETVCDLKNLNELYVDSNKLTHLPENIGELMNLERIGLNDNLTLENLPASFERLFIQDNPKLQMVLIYDTGLSREEQTRWANLGDPDPKSNKPMVLTNASLGK